MSEKCGGQGPHGPHGEPAYAKEFLAVVPKWLVISALSFCTYMTYICMCVHQKCNTVYRYMYICSYILLKPFINLAGTVHKLFSHILHNSKKTRHSLHLTLYTQLTVSSFYHNEFDAITHCRRWSGVFYKQV